MGIIVNDVLSLKIGIPRSGCYASFATSRLQTYSPSYTVNYIVESYAGIWIDKASRDSGSPSVEQLLVKTSITKDQLDGNIYTLLYDQLKTNYSSTTDILE